MVQTAREVFQSLGTDWAESYLRGNKFTFAGRTITIIYPSRSPVASGSSLVRQERVLIDGAEVGDGPDLRMATWPFDANRRSPHWFEAVKFVNRAISDSSLWVARRLQSADAVLPKFEIITLDARGEFSVQMLSSDQLQREYRMSSATSLIAEDVLPGYPLSVVSFVWFPLLWLVFPIGTSLSGLILMRRIAATTR